jgi:hypothetical protein
MSTANTSNFVEGVTVIHFETSKNYFNWGIAAAGLLTGVGIKHGGMLGIFSVGCGASLGLVVYGIKKFLREKSSVYLVDMAKKEGEAERIASEYPKHVHPVPEGTVDGVTNSPILKGDVYCMCKNGHYFSLETCDEIARKMLTDINSKVFDGDGTSTSILCNDKATMIIYGDQEDQVCSEKQQRSKELYGANTFFTEEEADGVKGMADEVVDGIPYLLRKAFLKKYTLDYRFQNMKCQCCDSCLSKLLVNQ